MMQYFIQNLSKRSYPILLVFLSLISTLNARPIFHEINSMREAPIHLGQLDHYPALVVIAPQYEAIKPAISLYHKLYQNFGNRTHLLISPDLPFYLSQKRVRFTLEEAVEEKAKSRVLLDWNRDTAQALFANESEQPLVILLEEDGTLLGRYHYEMVSEAFEFITATFSTVLPLDPSQLWASSSVQEIQ